MQDSLRKAAEVVQQADALVITAGAGMGVDSGLPDFRGAKGFWRAYPPLAKMGLRFEQMANPELFNRDVALAWGFYGHRWHLYRETEPHHGYHCLRTWAERKRHGAFVFTSNVDGHFQKAGFGPERVVEVHGSIHYLQCCAAAGIWPAEGPRIQIDLETMRAAPPYPACPNCGAVARPNILMFGDWEWESERTIDQQRRLGTWLDAIGSARLAVVECGAGRAIPTVRDFSERIATDYNGTLVRINPRDPEVPPGHVSLALSALEAIRAMDALLAP